MMQRPIVVDGLDFSRRWSFPRCFIKCCSHVCWFIKRDKRKLKFRCCGWKRMICVVVLFALVWLFAQQSQRVRRITTNDEHKNQQTHQHYDLLLQVGYLNFFGREWKGKKEKFINFHFCKTATCSRLVRRWNDFNSSCKFRAVHKILNIQMQWKFFANSSLGWFSKLFKKSFHCTSLTCYENLHFNYGWNLKRLFRFSKLWKEVVKMGKNFCFHANLSWCMIRKIQAYSKVVSKPDRALVSCRNT